MNDNNFNNALANVQLEGYEFTLEQIEFIKDLVERIDSKAITWEQAIEIVKERHSGKNSSN